MYTLRSAPGNPSILPLFGDKKPISYLTTNFNITQPQVSNDGRWAAYTSNESGRYEIYLQSFPEPHGKLQVSTAGGLFPRLRRDGKELFYMAPDEKLMAVSIESKGTSLQFSNPTPLFETRLPNGFAAVTGFRQQYDVTADGQRFLMNTTPRQAAEVPITVVLNWTAGLKK